MYNYKAKVTRVIDGDTIEVNIDLGFHLESKDQCIRLFGINAPEMRGASKEDGMISKMWLKAQIENKEVDFISVMHKKGKYGRWLGIICLDGRNINQEMVEQGYAIPIDT